MKDESGFALVTVLLLLALLMSLALGYFVLTRIEMSTTESSMNSVRGFYAAEAGLNLRAEQVRQIFQGYNRPAGTSPAVGDGNEPCDGGNTGSGDYACAAHSMQHRTTESYVVEPAGNPQGIVIPRGEVFQNLSAQEYRYDVFSTATSEDDLPEAVLQMRFKSRLVPMFQFAAFYNKDLEILPGPTMTLEGPVHSNGDLYLGTHNSLDILGQLTTAGKLFHGRKDDDVGECMAGPVRVADPENQTAIPACSGGTRREITQPEVAGWNGMIVIGSEVLSVPPPEALDPVPGETYWDKADLRIVLDLDTGAPVVEVRDPDGDVDALATAALTACGVVTYSNSFYNNREGTTIKMMNVDVEGLLDCTHDAALMGVGKGIDETSEGGLVWHLTVEGPSSDTVNDYGVRLRNGGELASTSVGAPAIRGLTVVTDQAAYIEGDYNATNKKPAAVLCDSINVLSNAWPDADYASGVAVNGRVASNTTIHAALLAGTDTTGGVEGTGGQEGEYNGGLENYPRLHESWSGRTLTYRGSFVSLNTPRHVDGQWIYGAPQYTAPTRDWRYDTDFNDAEKLPPLSPRFVYLRQDLFVRDFEL